MPEAKSLVQDKKQVKWPLSANGYFIRSDGKIYTPSPVHEQFLKSDARNVALFGPRGCLDGKTLVGGVPVAEKKSPSIISTIHGDSWSSLGYKKGFDSLFLVTTEMGYQVSVTGHHRFLSPSGWQPLNQLSIGSLILSDGTLHVKSHSGKSSNYLDDYSSDFHQCGELHGLLVRASLNILQQLHMTADDSNAQFSPFHLSIADSFALLLYQFFLGYSVGTISFEQLSYLFQIALRSLDKFFRSNKYCLQNQVDKFSLDYDYLSQHGYLTDFSELGSLLAAKHLSDVRSVCKFALNDTYHTSVSDPGVLGISDFGFLSTLAYPYEARNLYQTYDTYVWIRQDIIRTLGLLDSHYQFLRLFEQFSPTIDVFALAELPLQYYKIWQFYKPVQSKSSESLQSLVQSFLPEYVDELHSNLSFSVFPSYLLQCSIDNSNSITRFDKIQDIKFDKFGEYYDLSVLGTESYFANGLVHHNCGKSASGSQKALFKVKDGESGLIMAPDFENLKLSTWPEFREWIPWHMVVISQRHRSRPEWQPNQPFKLVFVNGASIYFKGAKESGSSRGINANWMWYDEAGRDDLGIAWHIANAGIRVGNNPQAWATYTPRNLEHWSYKFFITQDIPADTMAEFEKVSKGDRILIQHFHATREDNAANLDKYYYINVASSYPTGHLRAQEYDGEYANEGGKIGDARWFDGKVRDTRPDFVNKRVRFWDLAATEKKVVGIGTRKKDINDPDESVGSLVSKYLLEKKDNFCIEHQIAGQWGWDALLDVIVNTARHDGPHVPIVLEEEPGSGGKNQVAAVKTHLKRFPELAGVQVIGQRARDVGDRVMAANHWFAIAADGRMWIVKGVWNQKFLSQLDGFTQIEHDDYVTSITGAMNWLSPFKSWVRVPFISL